MAVGDGLRGTQRDAFVALRGIFQSYGLGSLSGDIERMLVEGYSPDTIGILLQETPAFKRRFSANDARRKAGLPALSPAEYLSVEKSYRQIMSAAGLPPGFYDKPEDFNKFIANDISPQEIQSRVTQASDFVNSASNEAKAMFGQWYTKGDMVAYALDPKRAAPLVGKAFATAAVGGAASQQGLSIGLAYAEDIAEQGFNAQQASQGFATVNQASANARRLAALGGERITDRDLMDEVFFNDSDVTLQRTRLSNEEEARFGGSSGTGASSLGKTTSGSF